MRPLMVLGCSSNAGKSLMVTALCRWFARRGVDVAPFKAQNMSNNARVVDGGEIGVAQWLQARAAGLEPTVDMNPVLLKPEADDRSQVIVNGVARPDITATPWRDRGAVLWPVMTEAFQRVADAHELVIIEGAGSPAEINLPDLVNNRMLVHSDANALLVADIDLGGAFAHIVGTWTLVPQATRERLAGFVLNKFRGDADLLEPGPSHVSALTGMHHVGVMPMIAHHLPDEEGGTVRSSGPPGAISVAIVRYPYASNLDEWHLLAHAAAVRWATTPAELGDADLIVLPGSKHLAADARWLHERGFVDAIAAAAARGTRIIGVCGGAMLLGTRIDDPHRVEGGSGGRVEGGSGSTVEGGSGGASGGSIRGIGLLALSTELAAAKRTTMTTVAFPGLAAPWHRLGGLAATGYEIRHGAVLGPDCAIGDNAWLTGPVLATTVHGLFEDPAIVEAVCGVRPSPVLERTFDRLADSIDEHLDMAFVDDLVRSGLVREGSC